ncbi:MAG: hypothetical protein LBI43_01335 [Streptococcaceae bacterium]|jgi:hypothetical protein|nr:hypothetical protein [Streptococcaceae bacterium]
MGLLKDIWFYVKRLSEEREDIKGKLDVVKDEAFIAQKTGQKIARRVEEFQFSAQGNIDEIKRVLEKYQKPSE